MKEKPVTEYTKEQIVAGKMVAANNMIGDSNRLMNESKQTGNEIITNL